MKLTLVSGYLYVTHSIDVSQGVMQYIDIGSKADGNVQGNGGVKRVLAAMENIGQIEQGYVHGKSVGKVCCICVFMCVFMWVYISTIRSILLV